MSPDVARFLLDLLGAQTLRAGADDFETVASLVVRAKRELAAVMSAQHQPAGRGDPGDEDQQDQGAPPRQVVVHPAERTRPPTEPHLEA